MILLYNYIIYIIYSFLLLFSLYVVLLIYKKYSHIIFNKCNNEIIITSGSKKSKDKIKNMYNNSNNIDKINKLKNKYKIESTVKSYEDIKYISTKPNYINVNDKFVNNFNFENISNLNKIINYKKDIKIQKITQTYLETKQIFNLNFINSQTNEHIINNINDFEIYHKNNLSNNSNILIKFYSSQENYNKYLYIYVNKNKMIKIIHNEEYDNICNMIEKNNGSFMLEDTDGNNIIGYGSYSQSEIKPSDIEKIFFSNNSNYKTNKNYNLLCEFNYIKIYFYVCNKI